MTTLVIFMLTDYVTGLMCAGIFHKSLKSKNGALESNACFKGLVRKCVVLIIVLVAYRLDLEIGTSYIRDTVCIAFTANESISIVENAGLMGVPIPAILTNAIDLLKNDANKDDKHNDSQ